MILINKDLKRITNSLLFRKFVDKYEILALKLNLCTLAPPPATTNLEFAKELSSIIHSMHKEFYFAESDQATSTADMRVKRLGFDFEPLINMSELKQSKDPMLNILEVDTALGRETCGIISMAIPKATDIGYFTCATKNLFGMFPYKYKGKFHDKINKILVEISNTLGHRSFGIVDCGMGMEGPGSPVKGKAVKMPQFYVAGDNMLELDAWIAKNICGFNIEEIPYLKSIDFTTIDVDGIDIFEEVSQECQKIGHFRPTKLTFGKSMYYWVWEHLDNPLLSPIRVTRSATK